MGSPSIPAQPAPPDYAAANQAGVYADIGTLAVRNQINQAAQLGQRIEYKDPATGETKVADFTGMGNAAAAAQAAQILSDQNAAMQEQQLALRQKLGVANVQQTNAELQAADPNAWDVRQRLTQQIQQGLNSPSSLAPDTSAAQLNDRVRALASTIPDGQQRLGSIYNEATQSLVPRTNDAGATAALGALSTEAASRLGQQIGDAGTGTTLGNLQSLAGRIGQQTGDMGAIGSLRNLQGVAANQLSTRANDGGTIADLTNLRDAAGRVGAPASDFGTLSQLSALRDAAATKLGLKADDATARSQLGDIYNQAAQLPQNFTDPSQAALNPALQKALDEYKLGGQLSDDERQLLTNDVRSAQAARGNYLGDGATAAEAGALRGAEDQRKQERLGNLLNVQQQTFGQGSTLRDQSQNAAMQRLGALSSAQATGYGQAQGLRAENTNNTTTQISTLQNLLNQIYGTGSSTAQTDRTAAAQQIAAQSGLDQQIYGTGAGVRGENQQAATNQINTLAQLAQQIFGTGSSVAAQNREATAQQVQAQSGLAQQQFGNNAALAAQNQQATTNKINTLAGLSQQLFGNQQTLDSARFGQEQARLGMLSGLQSQGYGQQQQTYQNQLGALNTENSLNQQQIAQNQYVDQTNYARDQQRLSNASAMVLGQPITNQFGSLQGAVNGAVGSPQGVNYQQAGQLNQNAGNQSANFASGNFGTLGNMWNTQANIAAKGNPWMGLLGSAAGAAAGAGIAAMI